jgi:hypothetical protein
MMHQVYVAEKPIMQPSLGEARLSHQANVGCTGLLQSFSNSRIINNGDSMVSERDGNSR